MVNTVNRYSACKWQVVEKLVTYGFTTLISSANLEHSVTLKGWKSVSSLSINANDI